jgi:hypothetical protein
MPFQDDLLYLHAIVINDTGLSQDTTGVGEMSLTDLKPDLYEGFQTWPSTFTVKMTTAMFSKTLKTLQQATWALLYK